MIKIAQLSFGTEYSGVHPRSNARPGPWAGRWSIRTSTWRTSDGHREFGFNPVSPQLKLKYQGR